MLKPDILDEIINQLDPELIPSEFVVMAKIRTFDGMESILSGVDMEAFMTENSDQIAEIRVILNVKLIRSTILEITDKIFAEAYTA